MKLKNLGLASLLAVTLTVTPGCATVFAGAGSPVEVVVDAPSEGVVIEVESDRRTDDRVVRNLNNLTTHLRRDLTYTVKVSRPGYRSQAVPVQRTLTPWLLADLLPLALGLGVLAVHQTRATPSSPSRTGNFGTDVANAVASSATTATIQAILDVVVTIAVAAGTGVTAGALGVDFLTGNAWNQSPDRIRVTLEEEK